ncbi:hypothetical protein [Stenotrophomonas maltophilia]|uniref:hypothetical protein n=1 Tax=Stenotrophomonas maltophilia TaxID=40324 RepID=UPI0021C8C9DE|nr:hypothetical protein [Stenotrophomonas maltophilia]MCU1137001.1 hypothetical protein [Stenotrophomonas maltophilia]
MVSAPAKKNSSSNLDNGGKTTHFLDNTTVKAMGIDTHMAELRAISAKWWRCGKRVWICTATIALLAALAMGASYFFEPGGAFGADLDIPAQITAAMPDNWTTLGMRMTTAVGSMYSSIGKFTLPLGFLILVGGALRWMLTDSDSTSPMMPLAMGSSLIAFSLIAGPELGYGDTPTTEEQNRELVSWIESSSLADSPAGLYVRAQAALSTKDGAGKDPELFRAAARAIQTSTYDFEPVPRSLYFIEQAAYGFARSPAAVGYVNARLYKKSTAKTLATALGSASTVGFIVAMTYSVLGLLVHRRWRRLRQSIVMLRRKGVMCSGLVST